MGAENSKTKKSTKLHLRQRRIFSEEFKRDRVADILSGKVSISSLSRSWQVSAQSIYTWIYKYSVDQKKGTTIVVQKDSESNKNIELEKKVAELERALGQKQMALDYLNKLIEIASKELDIDLKKNFSPGP